MKVRKLLFVAVALLPAGLLISSRASAQVTADRMDALRARMEQTKEFFQNLPEKHQKHVSGAALNLMHTAKEWDQMEERMREGSLRPGQVRPGSLTSDLSGAKSSEASSNSSKLIPVSDPSNDFAFSVVTGFSQSETSTAWCGNNVVVGFNDSGSLPESIFFGPGGASFNGFARSTDQGKTFADQGFLNPGTNFFNFLAGDPVLGCASESTFHYSSLFETGTPRAPLSAISVSTSRDGGAAFGDPVVAASKNAFTHFLDKDWMAVDPTSPNRLFVTYTDFDVSGVCGFDPSGQLIPRIAIELVRSTNGGTTWGSPVVIDQVCSPPTVPGLFVQGSQVAVGPAGEVYVGWEFFAADFVTRELRIRRSTDHGATFAPFVKVDNVICVGDCFALQGGFRDFLDLGSLVVDRSGTPSNGTVYIVWQDGRNLLVPDFGSLSGFYGYSDVLIRRSTDGGKTWSGAVRVNTNLEPLESGRGSDQYQPGAAVDNNGAVAACFYDRRNDPENFFIERFCAVSNDAGATWKNKRITERSFAPFHATDRFINPTYMGDYDSLAGDFTQSRKGFIGAFQVIDKRGNPDVDATRFRVEEDDD
jgi:hypothetical protein